MLHETDPFSVLNVICLENQRTYMRLWLGLLSIKGTRAVSVLADVRRYQQ